MNNYYGGRNKYNLNVVKSHTYTKNEFVSNKEFLPFIFVISPTLHLFHREPLCLAYYRFMQFNTIGLLLLFVNLIFFFISY